MNPDIDPEEAWRHCVDVYEKQAVDLLRQQDENGLDVVLHLFAGYARERHGIALDDAEMEELALLVRPWREGAVLPLRALRRAMKDKPAPGAGGARSAEAVRGLVQQAELRAERAQLEALCGWLQARVNRAA